MQIVTIKESEAAILISKKMKVKMSAIPYYSAIKRNEIGSFAEMCMDLECHTE